MLFKKFISIISAASIAASMLVSISPASIAAEEPELIECTQSASIINDGANFVLNTADKQTHDSISWNNTSGEWKGVGVLEFELPAVDGSMLKSAELTYTVNNPAENRKGGRTYGVYQCETTIDNSTTADTIKSMTLGTLMYTGAAINEGTSRTDTIPSDSIKDYVKSKLCEDAESKIQFAFSNSSQVLNIDPSSASLKITLYGGGIALGEHELTLLSGGAPAELSVNIFEEGIDEDALLWSSSDEDVVLVDGGVITPISAGEALVTVSSPDGAYTDECVVTVLQAAEGIWLDKTSLSLTEGADAGELTVKFVPENAVNREVLWTSSNDDVAAVSSNGIVTPVASGTAVITAAVKDTNLKADCTVTVSKAAQPQSVTLSSESVSLPKLGATVSLTADVSPENADSRLEWTSSNDDVAAVYDGVIVAGEVGEAVITATATNGVKAECTVTVTEDEELITNDRFYTDTDGNPIFSQGGGIFKFPGDDTYYWYGVRYKESVSYVEEPNGANRSVEHPVMEAYTCYTSDDLVNWEYRGDVATMQTLGQSWCGWAGRCGVVYNEAADKYVLVSQFNGTIIASADNPLGPFELEKGYFWGGTELPVIANGDTGDLTMFYDEDGSAYMICSSAQGRSHLYVVPMRPSDYCDFDFENIREIPGSTTQYFDEDGTIKNKDKGGIEGDCMFKYKDHYYFTGSDLYGWHGSRCYVFESDSILGDYSEKPDYVTDKTKNIPYIMPGVKDSYAHNTQTGFYYTLHGSEQDLVIYCGDRWSSFCSNGLGFNQWVPLTMDGYTPHFNNLSQWRLDEEKGTWEVGDGNNYVSNSYFDADRVDLNNITGWECSDNIGGTANGNVKDKLYSGKYSARQSADEDYIARMKQDISELPDGTYTLRAIAKSSGGQNECKLYVKTADEEYSASLKSGMNDWTDVVIKDIEIKDGKCEVGLFSDAYAGNWVRLDDVYLTRNYDGTVLEGKMNTNVPGETDGGEVYAEDGVAITAEYNSDGSLKSIKSVETVKAGDSVISSDDPNTRVFAWNSLDGMIPIKTSSPENTPEPTATQEPTPVPTATPEPTSEPEDTINETVITPLMTYVDFFDGADQADTAFGYVDTAIAGYNKFDGTIGWGNKGWNVNKVAYLKLDASEITDSSIIEATLTMDVSGSIDSKRTTGWGVFYTPYTGWDDTLTYNKANSSGMMSGTAVGDLVYTSTKSASTFETKTIDITDAVSQDEDRIITIGIYETAAAGGYVKNPSVKIVSSNSEVFTVVYDVNGELTYDSVTKGSFVNEDVIPATDRIGYIFKGWAVGEDILSQQELLSTPINADTTFTAVYEEDTSYIEPVVNASISGPSSMSFGADPDTPTTNTYTVTLEGERGTVITAETMDDRVEDFTVEWTLLGFKTENDTKDQYCDSYGEIADHAENATSIDFMLKQVDMNFYGTLSAHITYNGDEFDVSMPVVALGSKSAAGSQILPEPGYPSDIDEYDDSLTGYVITKETYGNGNDAIVGGWSMSGSDNASAVITSEDTNKFIRITCPTSKKSHMFTNVIDTPETQAIFEQDIRFNDANAVITLTSKYPFYNSSYTNPVTLLFTGAALELNGTPLSLNERTAAIATGKWYRVVLSVDKTNETCFAKVYDTDGTLLGETENVKWKEESSPTFYSIGFDNSYTGSIDVDNYTAYYPTVDASTYTLTASQQTLSIPNRETALLSASVKTKDGYDITGAASWSVLEEDMRESIIITPDDADSHKAVLSLADTAVAGEVSVQVNIGGYTKTIGINITDSKESVRFTQSKTSIPIPIDADKTETVQYSAIIVDGDGADQGRDVSLALYDKDNTNAYTLPEGITFDAETGILTVTSSAVPCTFNIRATGENSNGEVISRSVKVTVHGLSFDFGSGADESLADGYTEVTPDTAYTESRGYGIEGKASAGGSASTADARSDYLEGSFTFKADVSGGEVYKVTVNFSGDLATERVNDYLTGHERTLAAEATSHTGYTVRTDEIAEQVYYVPVVDGVLDLNFTNAKVSSIVIERVERTPSEKPNIYSVGDSTLGNNGSYGYTLYRNLDKYPELTEIATYHNNGKGSRNLQTYYTQGWLDSVLTSIKPGDIVTIGNMGTNPGGLSGSQFKAPLDYYVDACLTMGAKVILTSYTPHGCVSGYEYVYDSSTHTFHGCRQDAYDSQGIRVIYEERKSDERILGFIDIGKMADDAFTAYTADYEKHGYDSPDAAAQAIISCFPDHNHYNKGTLACELMLDGYEGAADGIVAQLVGIISGEIEK